MKGATHVSDRTDIHQTVTNKIIAAIEAGAGDWKMPWHRPGGAFTVPSNVATGNSYRGINIISLWVEAEIAGFARPIWGTYRQWKEAGAQVRKGEKGSLVVFYKPIEGDDDSDDDTASPQRKLLARASHVFNAAQVDGYQMKPEAPRADLTERLDHVDRFIAATGAAVEHGGNRAFYRRPPADIIAMPGRDLFTGSATSSPTEAYYATYLHELAHWTGAEPRLNRTFGKRFGDKDYAFEELIAEISAAYLCAELGIANEPRHDHAQYLASWLEVLRADSRAIFTAASQASQVTAFLNGLQPVPPLPVGDAPPMVHESEQPSRPDRPATLRNGDRDERSLSRQGDPSAGGPR